MNKLSQNKMYRINFGPQHPAAHGVLRLLIVILGEVVYSIDPHIGLLHRGTEKLAEYRRFLQNLPYMDRLDYVSMMAQEHTYSLLSEQLLGQSITRIASYTRVLMLEITRILNHLMSLTTHAMDVGALTPFLWAFEEREKLMEIYESVSGARMHANYIRPGGVTQPITKTTLGLTLAFINQFISRIDEIEDMLTANRIWTRRLKGIGIVTAQKGIEWGFSGVLLRGSGVLWDLRKTMPYEKYGILDFLIPTGLGGDCFDRYLIRIQEMRESVAIIEQCCCAINNNSTEVMDLLRPHRFKMRTGMEALIAHFKWASEDLLPPEEDIYIGTEAPKGEFGLHLATDLQGKIKRLKIRAPGFFHLQGLKFMAMQHLLADVVTLIGTQDVVFGEIDR